MAQMDFSRRLFLCFASAVPLAAGDSWKNQDPSEWSVEQAEEVLTDSSWAKPIKAALNRGAREDEGRATGSPGGLRLPGGIGSIGMGGGDGGSPQGQRPEMNAVLLWASALPVRQARLVKGIAEESAGPSTAEDDSHYVLELHGVSRHFAQRGQERVNEEFHATTTLNRKNKSPLSPEEVEVHTNVLDLTVLFRFSKHDPIQLEDKEVEFQSSLGSLKIKRKFKLKSMVYQGHLAL